MSITAEVEHGDDGDRAQLEGEVALSDEVKRVEEGEGTCGKR